MVDLDFLLQEHLPRLLSLLTTFTALLFIVELVRLVMFVRGEREASQIERKMVGEGTSEKEAEEEVKEEKKVRRREKKVATLALDEFIVLKELMKEVEEAAPGKDLLDRAGKKLRALKKEEKLESRLTKRLQPLIDEALRLAKIEPKKKSRIDEDLLEIKKANDRLLALMAEGGRFETLLNKPVGPGFTKENKKDNLIAVLREALKQDQELIAATKKLEKLLE